MFIGGSFSVNNGEKSSLRHKALPAAFIHSDEKNISPLNVF